MVSRREYRKRLVKIKKVSWERKKFERKGGGVQIPAIVH